MSIFQKQQNEHQRRAFNRGVELQAAGVIKDHLSGWYLVGWEWAEKNLKPQRVEDIRKFDQMIREREVVG